MTDAETSELGGVTKEKVGEAVEGSGLDIGKACEEGMIGFGDPLHKGRGPVLKGLVR